MKIVILTSDILDGKIVLEHLLSCGRDVRTVLYEKCQKDIKLRLKSFVRLLYSKFYLRGRDSKALLCVPFERIAQHYRQDIIIKNVKNINDKQNIDFLKSLEPELFVVIGTRVLKKDVFNIPDKGAINLHSGILPYYRGADSEFWALYNNEPDKIGVSIHFIDEGLDSGDIILTRKQEIHSSDDYRSLRIKNLYIGAKMIDEAITLIEEGRCRPVRQDSSIAKLYKPVQKSILKECRRNEKVSAVKSVPKEFGTENLRCCEKVADSPSILTANDKPCQKYNFFCLRIDADEYERNSFLKYLDVFRKYKDAVTIFINAHRFLDARDEIIKCKEAGLDIQSHGFYHYTYSDYRSNRYNINKAKDFFKKLGIEPKGFAAPMGRWNINLIRALEDEGYLYSSDFSYDYLGFPSFPFYNMRYSRVLEIPVFPVAPELFFQNGEVKLEDLTNYYKRAIDEMQDCGIPIIIYAHTNPGYPEIPQLLDTVANYALNKKNLKPCTMTEFCDIWKLTEDSRTGKRPLRIPGADFFGRDLKLSAYSLLKDFIKERFDFERITPVDELQCTKTVKAIKILFRNICKQ